MSLVALMLVSNFPRIATRAAVCQAAAQRRAAEGAVGLVLPQYKNLTQNGSKNDPKRVTGSAATKAQLQPVASLSKGHLPVPHTTFR